MVAKEISDSKIKLVIPLRILVIALLIPLALGPASIRRVANTELVLLLASTSIAISLADMMKVIKLLLNKNNYNNKLEYAWDRYISIPYYKSKRGRELCNKVLAGIPLAQHYKLTHLIALKYLHLLRRTSDTFY